MNCAAESGMGHRPKLTYSDDFRLFSEVLVLENVYIVFNVAHGCRFHSRICENFWGIGITAGQRNNIFEGRKVHITVSLQFHHTFSGKYL